MPDPAAPRKLRWAGLWFPFLVAGLLLAGWSAGWLYAARKVEAGLASATAALKASGGEASWSGKRLSGYPFRINLVLTDLRLSASGWNVEVPDLEAQAFLHAPRNWLVAAPRGLTVVRPEGGGLEVSGDRLLASLAAPAKGGPRISAEGLGLAFTPSPGARPFALAGAGRLEFHVRPGPDDQVALFLRLEDGKPTPGRLFADLGGGSPVSAEADGVLERASALRGASRDALSAWGRRGGRLDLRSAGLTAGQTRLSLASPGLAPGPGGQLSGRLSLQVSGAPQALAALARNGVISPLEAAGGMAATLLGRRSGDDTRVDLELSEGRVRLARPGQPAA